MYYFSDYYPLILVLQAFCLYHAYKNNNQQKWYWLIIFLPLIGCLIYLYDNFYNRRNINNITEGVKGLVYSNYALDKLEKEVKFSETITNKTSLADAYTERGRYAEAIKLYISCQKGFNESNVDLLRKILRAYYLNKEYQKVVEIGEKLEPNKSNDDVEYRVAFAWALHFTGNTAKAEEKFKEMDARFTNFLARLEFSKFLIEIGKSADSRNILNHIIEEYDAMESYEKKLKRDIVREAKRLLQSLK